MSVDTNGPNIQRLIDATLGDSFYTQLVSFLRAFDGMAQPAVLDKDLATPPASPANGDRYIIAANPTGVWAGKAGQVARYYTSQAGNGWEYWSPRAGWAVAVVDEVDANGQPLRYSYNGSVWGQAAGGGSGGGMANPMTAQDDIIIGGVSGAPTRLAHPSTVGWVLTFTASGVAWAAASGGGGGGMTNPMTMAGDLIIGGASGAPTRLGVGNADQVLTVINAATGQLGWVTPTSGGGGGDFYKNGSVAMTGPFNQAPQATLTAASNVNIGGASSDSIYISGAATINSFSGGVDGMRRQLQFAGGIVLADGLVPGGVRTTLSGDTAEFQAAGPSTWRCLSYTKADGTALVSSGGGSGDFKKDGSVAMTGAFNEAPIVAAPFTGGTLDVSTIPSNTVLVTNNGGSALTGLSNLSTGIRRTLIFAYNGLAVTHNANLIMPGGVTVSTTAGDRAEFVSRGSGVWECNWYTKKDGTALVGAPDGTKLPLAGGRMTGAINESTFTLCATGGGAPIGADVVGASNNLYVYGSGSIGSLAEMPEGSSRRLFFFTGCQLQNGSTLLLLTGANINAVAGDWCEFVSMGTSGWRMTSYARFNGTPLVGGSGDFKANGSVPMTGPVNEAAMVRLGSNTTLDIGAAAANVVDLYYNNSVLINSFGTAAAGIRRTVTRTGRDGAGNIGQDTAAITLTHNSDTLVLPTGANISMRIGDSIEMESLGGGKWHCLNYQRGDGTSLAGGSGDLKKDGSVQMTGAFNEAQIVNVAAASTINLDSFAANTLAVSGSGTVNTFSGGTPGAVRRMRFTQAGIILGHLTGNILLPSAANIAVAVNDVAEFVSLTNGQWLCTGYQRADGTALVSSGGSGDFKKDGTTQMTGGLNEATVPNTSASGGTVSAAVAASANTILIQTTDPVTGIGSLPAGSVRRLTVDRQTTFTNSASFLLFGSANIILQNNDVATFLSMGSGSWKMIGFARAAGTPLITPSSPVKFSVTKDSVAQSFPAGAVTKVLFQTAYSNVGGGFDIANSKFVCPVAGDYLINFAGAMVATATNDTLVARLYKNGERIGNAPTVASSPVVPTGIGSGGSMQIPLVVGDVLELYVFNGGTTARDANANVGNNVMFGFKI